MLLTNKIQYRNPKNETIYDGFADPGIKEEDFKQ